MVVTSLQRSVMDALVSKLKYIIPDINFMIASSFSWSPATKTISYPSKVEDVTVGSWSLIHETGHAVLRHTSYQTDVELLLMEVAAWQEARKIAKKIDIVIDEDHIQNCLDTYRDWLHQRSTCPTCGVVSLQHTDGGYKCHNCSRTWRVTTSRFCRPYRMTKTGQTKRPHSGSKTRSAAFL